MTEITTQDCSKSFAERLRALMRARGLISTGSATGVDVSRLAQITGTSYEMARRYAAGEATPRPGKLEAIAKWLGVSQAELAYGKPAPLRVDEALLAKCIQSARESQLRSGISLPPAKTARLVAVLYQEEVDGSKLEAQSIDLMSRALQ